MAATMPVSFRRYWRELQQGRPGHRFQSRYERSRRSDGRSRAGLRILLVALALVLIAIGVVLLVIPGPGIPFLLLGGGMLATESQWVARLMDWSEIKGRRVAAWGKRRWKRLPVPVRIVLMFLGAGCSAVMAYVVYRTVSD
jgi:hypothetical protein